MRETFIIGEKEFACYKIPAFQANSILLRLQKVIIPAIGVLKSQNVMDMDIKQAASALSENLNEETINTIVLPMFKHAQVACVTDNVKIDSELAINKVFVDADGLADFYQLIFEVLKYNFGNFIKSLASRFGDKDGAASKS